MTDAPLAKSDSSEITTLKVDNRGRVIIPQPLRQRFGIEEERALLRLHLQPRYNLDEEKRIVDEPEEVQTVEMDERGRVTIPKKVRERYGIVADDVLMRVTMSVSKMLDEDE